MRRFKSSLRIFGLRILGLAACGVTALSTRIALADEPSVLPFFECRHGQAVLTSAYVRIQEGPKHVLVVLQDLDLEVFGFPSVLDTRISLHKKGSDELVSIGYAVPSQSCKDLPDKTRVKGTVLLHPEIKIEGSSRTSNRCILRFVNGLHLRWTRRSTVAVTISDEDKTRIEATFRNDEFFESRKACRASVEAVRF